MVFRTWSGKIPDIVTQFWWNSHHILWIGTDMGLLMLLGCQRLLFHFFLINLWVWWLKTWSQGYEFDGCNLGSIEHWRTGLPPQWLWVFWRYNQQNIGIFAMADLLAKIRDLPECGELQCHLDLEFHDISWLLLIRVDLKPWFGSGMVLKMVGYFGCPCHCHQLADVLKQFLAFKGPVPFHLCGQFALFLQGETEVTLRRGFLWVSSDSVHDL